MSVSSPVIQSWDGVNRRIYLKQGVDSFHWIDDIYKEYRNWRRTDESSRKWEPFLKASGNEPKGGGKYTPRYVTMLEDARVIPYDENILITVTGEAITDNADVDPDPFDTSTRTQPLKLYITPPASELVRAESEIAAVNRMSYNERVYVDPIKGTPPTNELAGNQEYPVQNMAQAYPIAVALSLNTFYFLNSYTLDGDEDISDYEIIARNHVTTEIIIEDGVDCPGLQIKNCIISGVLDGYSDISDCSIHDITFFNGHIHNSSLAGKITLAGGVDAYLANCSRLDINIIPVINMGGSGQNAVVTNYSGALWIENLTGANKVGIGLSAGTVILDSETITSGSITVSGNGNLQDETGKEILSGVWNEGVTIKNNLINRSTISEATQLGEAVYVDAVYGYSGTTFPVGSKRYPTDNIQDADTIAKENNIDHIQFLSDYTFPDGTFLQDYHLVGKGITDTTFTFVTSALGCIVLNCTFEHATLTGNFSGSRAMEYCKTVNLGSIGLAPSSSEIIVKNTLVDGVISLPSNYSGKLTIIDSYSNVVGEDTPRIDFGHSTAYAQCRNWTGGIEIYNATQGNIMSIDLISGQVKLDPTTVTNAIIVVRGNGKVVNSDTGEFIPDGIWNGNVTVVAEANNPQVNADAIFTKILP